MTSFDIAPGTRVSGRVVLHVAVPPEVLWDKLADLPGWGDWNSAAFIISVDGPPVAGTRFRWTAGRLPVASILQVADRPRAFGWTGRSIGIRARHVWRFEPAPGGTRLVTQEFMEGLLPSLFPGAMTRVVQQALEKGAQALVDACLPARPHRRAA